MVIEVSLEAGVASAVNVIRAARTYWRLNFMGPKFGVRGKAHPYATL
jgi:hypothetical protein